MRPAFYIASLLLLFTFSCTPKDAGYVTLANTGVTTLNLKLNDRSFTVLPANHVTKKVSEGAHSITFDTAPPLNINVIKGRTTLYDSTGLACFVVADFTPRYSGGQVGINEKIVHQKLFTTKESMISIFGSPLPKKLKAAQKALRLQQVDCEIIENSSELAMELAFLP